VFLLLPWDIGGEYCGKSHGSKMKMYSVVGMHAWGCGTQSLRW
jgi:hypothetical protein